MSYSKEGSKKPGTGATTSLAWMSWGVMLGCATGGEVALFVPPDPQGAASAILVFIARNGDISSEAFDLTTESVEAKDIGSEAFLLYYDEFLWDLGFGEGVQGDYFCARLSPVRAYRADLETKSWRSFDGLDSKVEEYLVPNAENRCVECPGVSAVVTSQDQLAVHGAIGPLDGGHSLFVTPLGTYVLDENGSVDRVGEDPGFDVGDIVPRPMGGHWLLGIDGVLGVRTSTGAVRRETEDLPNAKRIAGAVYDGTLYFVTQQGGPRSDTGVFGRVVDGSVERLADWVWPDDVGLGIASTNQGVYALGPQRKVILRYDGATLKEVPIDVRDAHTPLSLGPGLGAVIVGGSNGTQYFRVEGDAVTELRPGPGGSPRAIAPTPGGFVVGLGGGSMFVYSEVRDACPPVGGMPQSIERLHPLGQGFAAVTRAYLAGDTERVSVGALHFRGTD